MDLSVCIVNWNTSRDLERALGSLAQGGRGLEYEIIVVDNRSRDDSVRMVKERFPQVQLICNQANLGFAAANNQAIAQSKGDFVLLLNSDTLVHPGALARLVEFMRDHPDCAVAGAKLLNRDGSLQFSCRRFPRMMAGFFRKVPLGRLLPENRYNREYLMSDWDHNQVREVDWVSGAAACLRREAIKDVGPLDEGYYMYCEDVDWCWRARQRGWKVYYVPEAVITHYIGRSSDQRPLAMVLRFHDSMIRFYWKHYAVQYRWPLRWIPPLGILARCSVVLTENLVTSVRNLPFRLRRRRAEAGP